MKNDKALETASPLLRRLLLKGGRQSRLGVAMGALGAGLLLLLLSVLLWWNFRELLSGRASNDPLGAAFLTLSKTVDQNTAATPGKTAFSPAEVEAVRSTKGVQDVGALVSNDFPLVASLGGELNFYTLMFLEAAPDRMLDKRPDDWHWEPGNPNVPILLSSDFLNLYNYGFAISQGLPQLSETMIRQLPFKLTVGSGGAKQDFQGRVAGFSDRINSILVPEAFITYANQQYGSGVARMPSRLIVKVDDPSGAAFNAMLREKGFSTNSEQLRLNKLRNVVTAISGGTGVLALLLLLVSVLVFVLFVELTVARAQESVRLLMQLGYSPAMLGRFLFRSFLPKLAGAWGVAVALAAAAQAGVAYAVRQQGDLMLPWVPGWVFFVVALGSGAVLLALLRRAVGRAVAGV